MNRNHQVSAGNSKTKTPSKDRLINNNVYYANPFFSKSSSDMLKSASNAKAIAFFIDLLILS